MRSFIALTFLMLIVPFSVQEKEEPVSFKLVQEVSIYSGYTVDNQYLRKCFTRKPKMHFARNFNSGFINNSAFSSVNKKILYPL